MFQHVHLAGVKQYYYHPWQGCYQAEIHAQIPLILTVILCFQFSGDAGFLQAHPPMGIAITALVIINVSFYILIKLRIFFHNLFQTHFTKKNLTCLVPITTCRLFCKNWVFSFGGIIGQTFKLSCEIVWSKFSAKNDKSGQDLYNRIRLFILSH